MAEQKGVPSQPTYPFTTPQAASLPYFAFMEGTDSTGFLNCWKLTCRVKLKEVEKLVLLTQSFMKKTSKGAPGWRSWLSFHLLVSAQV